MENTVQSWQRRWLFDHLVRPHQHVRRNRQTDLLGGFEIDHELELLRLLDRKISGLGALQNFVHVCMRRDGTIPNRLRRRTQAHLPPLLAHPRISQEAGSLPQVLQLLFDED